LFSRGDPLLDRRLTISELGYTSSFCQTSPRTFVSPTEPTALLRNVIGSITGDSAGSALVYSRKLKDQCPLPEGDSLAKMILRIAADQVAFTR
jgi:hypothetical protein